MNSAFSGLHCLGFVLTVAVVITRAQRPIFTQHRPPHNVKSMAQSMAIPRVMRDIARGLPPPPVNPVPRIHMPKSMVFAERNRINAQLEKATQNVAKKAQRMGEAQTKTTAFGPFMIANPKARAIARQGKIFTNIAKKGTNMFTAANDDSMECPFREVIHCNADSNFRTADGSCNNLQNPYWGKANTPFERFVPPQYGDNVDAPRNSSVFTTPLPLARVISTSVHMRSTVANLHPDISHMTMEFGQFVSHDINRNTISTGANGAPLACCNPDGSVDNDPDKMMLGCLPIDVPSDDPFFSTYNRTCMNFVRAAPTPNINCDRGYREQLNQESQFIDASTIYGSDDATMSELRTKSDGLLKVTSSSNGDLLLQNPGDPGCRSNGSDYCFKTGEVRANQQPALMTLHTLFMREHNRVATQLKTLNPSWNDERLFQEARKIVGAELQHITYNEYLPAILGNSFVEAFGFRAQPPNAYHGGYDSTFRPGIRNGFAAAGYRFGHGNVRDHVAAGYLFKDNFLNASVMYESGKGPSFVVRSLVQDNQQGSENLMSSQLTNHLFELAPGTGLDLASVNINRGRDHGLPSYNVWRDWCNLRVAESFRAEVGGLEHHIQSVADLLSNVYSHPDDIDLWTGIITEVPLEGRAVGPTGACVIGRQFWVLKNSDRFYYETNDPHAKFEMEQLNEIRKTTLARIICDNTDMTALPANVFDTASLRNPTVQCASLQVVELSEWQTCNGQGWSAWGPYTRCFGGFRRRRRTCNMHCAHLCVGRSFERMPCSTGIRYPAWTTYPGQYSRRARFWRHR